MKDCKLPNYKRINNLTAFYPNVGGRSVMIPSIAEVYHGEVYYNGNHIGPFDPRTSEELALLIDIGYSAFDIITKMRTSYDCIVKSKFRWIDAYYDNDFTKLYSDVYKLQPIEVDFIMNQDWSRDKLYKKMMKIIYANDFVPNKRCV